MRIRSAPSRSVLPPGPSSPPLVQAWSLGRNYTQYLEGCFRRYGDCFTLRLPGLPPQVIVSHPDDVERIFALPPDAYTQAQIGIPLPLGHRSIAVMDGQEHWAERKLLRPLVTGEHLKSYGQCMVEVARAHMDTLPLDRPFALRPYFQKLTLEAVVRSCIGLHDQSRVARITAATVAWLDNTLSPPVLASGLIFGPTRVRHWLDARINEVLREHRAPLWLAVPLAWQKVVKSKVELMTLLADEVRAQRAAGGQSKSTGLIPHLIGYRDEHGAGVPDTGIVEEAASLIVAGYETTSNAMSWAVHCVLADPDVHARVLHECKAAFPDGVIRPEKIAELGYLRACIDEVLRLHPVVPAATRLLVQPLELARRHIPAGVTVWAGIHLSHRHPELWRNPLAFEPERFLGKRPPAKNYYPFGGGKRTCLGSAFALHEMRIVLAYVLLHTRLQNAPSSRPYAMTNGFSLYPSDGAQVIRARPASDASRS